jgi:uncharacterized protein (DUF488 family)
MDLVKWLQKQKKTAYDDCDDDAEAARRRRHTRSRSVDPTSVHFAAAVNLAHHGAAAAPAVKKITPPANSLKACRREKIIFFSVVRQNLFYS